MIPLIGIRRQPAGSSDDRGTRSQELRAATVENERTWCTGEPRVICRRAARIALLGVALWGCALDAQAPTAIDVRPGPLVVALPVPVNDRYGWLGVPDIVWSGVVGAVVALCGVLAGNRLQIEIQQLEHRHDRDERSRERVNSLRRDAGVKLAASLPPVPGALTALTIGGPDELRDHRLSEFYAASALYVLAGSPETVSLVQGHANRVRDLATDIVTRLAPAHEDYGRHVAADGVYKGAASNVERVLSELFKLAESGAGGEDPRVVGLQGSLDHFERQAKEYQSTRDQALRAYRLKAAAVREAMSDEVKELRRAIPRIVAAIRHDLELPGPMDAFIATHDEATDRRWIKATAAIRLFNPAPVESGGESDAQSSAPRA